MNLSYNLQKQTGGLQINKLHNYQQFNKDNSYFFLFTMVVISDTNLRPVPGDLKQTKTKTKNKTTKKKQKQK